MLNNRWTLWYHSIKDTNWSKQSYKEIFVIENMFDYMIHREIIKPHHLYNGMLFLMKDKIYPIWEDPNNRMGCCLSFKIPYNKVKDQWDKYVLYVINELISSKPDTITGISIAPKKEFNIIKLWISQSNDNICNTIYYDDNLLKKDNMKCKKHILTD
jgi:hypothetical protein